MTYKSEKNKLQRSPQLNIPPNKNLISLFKLHQEKEMENQTKVQIKTRTETSQTRDRFHLVKILRIDLISKSQRTRSNSHAQVEHLELCL